MIKCSRVKKGFTLVEMLVTIAIFSIVVSTTIGFFLSAVRAQRKNFANQEILDQISYVLEYMGRALRMANKDLTGSCISSGYNYYQIPNGIKFLDSEGNCTEYYLENNQLKKKIGTEIWQLTSPKIKINQFKINLLGQSQQDNLQPRLTIFIEAEKGEGKIQIQTTISQRSPDFQY